MRAESLRRADIPRGDIPRGDIPRWDIRRLEIILGKVPSYRLVAACLAVLAVIALVASMTVGIGYPPLLLTEHLALTVGTTWLGSRLIGRLIGVRVFDLSSVVSGLLLFFLLVPTGTVGGMVGAIIAAGIASLSKFALRIGGRHIFNPAAIGAFAAGLTGLTVSGWWVATGTLLPFVALAALAIVVRTRLAGPAAALVVAGIVVTVTGELLLGVGPGEAVRTAVVSTPLIFLAAFLFTEPITLPPRRWQQLVEATLVGALAASPYLIAFRLPLVTPTPELALLIGNIVAVGLARPLGRTLRFTGRRQLTTSSVEYSFRAHRRFTHRAGQYLELHLPHRRVDRRGIRRTLTIVSAPGDPSAEIRVAVRTAERPSTFNGRSTRWYPARRCGPSPSVAPSPCLATVASRSCWWPAASGSPRSSASSRRSRGWSLPVSPHGTSSW